MNGMTCIAGWIGWFVLGALALLSNAFAATAEPSVTREEILPGLFLVKGCVNTAVFERNGRTLMIDSGELTQAPNGGPVDWVLVTHHHRDQASHVDQLVAAGAKLVVPALEEKLFSDADGFWQEQRHTLTRFHPSRFTRRESVPVARAVKAGDVVEWEGVKFETLETPGHTDGSVTYVVEWNGKRIAFTGDLIYGPGKIWDMHSLQNRVGALMIPHLGFGGEGERLFQSLAHVLDAKPDWLVPSHGVVMRSPRSAIEETRKNFDALMDNYLTTVGWPDFGQPRLAAKGRTFDGILAQIYPGREWPRLPKLPTGSYPSWIRDISWTTQALVADDGSVFLSDCGRGGIDVLARVRELLASGEIRRVEGVWPTHYHSDHSELLDPLRKATGAKVYVQRAMVDITENPFAYGLPYMSSQPARVDHIMEDGQTIDWHGIKLTFYHFPGQTEYHSGLLAEKDGFKAFFTGDSWANWGIEDYCTHFRCFLGEGRGYDKCLKILLECKPNILVQAHRGPMVVTEAHLRQTLATFQKREPLARKLFPHSDPNYGLDPYWVRAYPYRQDLVAGGVVSLEARITNHDTTPRTLRVDLRVPKGWKVVDGGGEVTIGARGEGTVTLRASAPAGRTSSRHVLGIAVTAEGRSYGELAEAIVDIAKASR